jgi:hypothetical protein
MATWPERAFDLVTEITKQVLTLSTGIIAITITFVKDFASHASPTAKDLLAWSWFIYAVSILFGMLTLMASAGVQAKATSHGAGGSPPPSINASNIRLLGGIQLLAFFIAIVLTVIAGALAV